MRSTLTTAGVLALLVAACAASTPSTAPSTAPSMTPSLAPTVVPSIAAVTQRPSIPLAPLAIPSSIPAPFGPAANGPLVYVDHGVVRWLDPTSGATGAIVAGVADDATVLPSRDGSRLALISKTPGGLRQLTVVGVDGRGLRTIPGTWSDDAEFAWSPDGRTIAIASTDTGIAVITFAPVDGSMPSTLDTPLDARHPWYLPDGRLLFAGTRQTNPLQYALYLTDPAGGEPIQLTKDRTEITEYIAARPSDDGATIVYHRWREPDQKGRIRLIDVATGVDSAFPVDYPETNFADENAQISPDGTRVLLTRFTDTDNRLVVVPIDGGAARPIGEVTPMYDAPEATFAPDGKQVIARYHDGHVWLLDTTGTGSDRQLDVNVDSLPAWLRLAAP